MIDLCVTMLEDHFESISPKKLSLLSYILLGNVDEDNAFVLENIKESYPELDYSLKLQLSFFHFTHHVNDE